MFVPGDTAPESAPYLVQHDKHRANHDVYATAGLIFPHCRQCGDAVRFTLLDASVFKAHTSLESDPDFSPAAKAGAV